MQRALEKLRSQVLSKAGKYSNAKKCQDLELVFSLVAKELKSGQVQSQRIMMLLRAVINAQPGSTKVVNEFLNDPSIVAAFQTRGNYNL